MSPPSVAPRRLRRSRAFVAILLGAALGLATVEAGARIAHRTTGEPWSAARAKATVAEARSQLFPRDWQREARWQDRQGEAAMTLHPFVGFISEYAQRMASELAERSQRSEANRVFEVGIVGGSVSCMVALESKERLVQRIGSDPRLAGRPVRVHMLGQGGWKQPQQLMMVAFAFSLGTRLDAIVNVDGFNEVAIGLQNRRFDAHPLYPSFPHWSHLLVGRATSPALQDRFVAMINLRDGMARCADRVLASRVLASAALGPLALRRVESGLAHFRAVQEAYSEELSRADKSNVTLHGPPMREGIEQAVEASVRNWYESSLSLAAACEKRGVRYLHVLQPTLHDAGAKTLTADELATSAADDTWITGVQRGYPLLRQAGQELAALGVEFLDASRIFADDERTLYFDSCHFGREGCDVLADAIADALLSKMH